MTSGQVTPNRHPVARFCRVANCWNVQEHKLDRSHALRDTDEAPTMDYAEVIIAINLVCTSVKVFAAQEGHNIYLHNQSTMVDSGRLYYVGLKGLGILINNRSRIENLRKTSAISCDAWRSLECSVPDASRLFTRMGLRGSLWTGKIMKHI